MRLTAHNDHGASLLTFSGAENCDTDGWPIVSQVFFRHYLGAYDAEYGAIATAIVFSRHCGAVAEFVGTRIGIDAARTIRAIVPDVEELLPIDGMKREIGQGSSSIVVGAVDRILDCGVNRASIGKSARVVTWSGDFVGGGERNSTGYMGGDIFTNALLVAKSTGISVAIGLLAAGRSLRNIFVPKPPKDEAEEFARIAAGLEFISIKLRTL